MLPACDSPEPLFPGPLPFPEAGTEAAKKLRVLQVTHCLVENPQAGTESYVANLGRAMADLGLEVSFLAPEGPPCQNSQEAIPWRKTRLLDLPLLQFTLHNQDFLTHVHHPGFEAAFREILQRHPVDLVHFHHTYLSSVSLLEVALDQGLPVVLTLHDAWHLCPQLHCVNEQGYCGGPEDLERCTACLDPGLVERTAEQRQNLHHFLTSRRKYVQTLLSRCRLLCPSRFLRNLHYKCGVSPGGIIHLPLGLDDLGPALDAPREGPPRFVFLGNIIPVKRLDLAIKAFVPLAGQAILEIWGGCPQAQRKRLRQSLAPYPHIGYRGSYRRSDLPRILAGAAALVMCSDFENYPLVARESLMLGVPVIASRAGGLPEIVHHGRNGLLFSPGDAEALRQTIQRFIRRPGLKERLRRGIGPVKTFAQEAKEMLGVYYSWIALSSRPPDVCPTPQPRPESDGVPASIIIPAWNNLALTRDCLEAIWRHTAPGTYEIIVVDNGSTDGTPEFLQGLEEHGQIRVVRNDNNLGFAPACNQGARAARGEFLLFLNNDTKVTSGWLEELIRSAREHPQVAAVGAKLLYPDDTVQHAGVTVSADKKFLHIYKNFHKDHPAVNKERTFRILTAACLLVKKEPFFQAGGFDENYHNGCEDVDLCLRFWQQGLELLYNPRAVVYHLESKTPGRFDREAENSQLVRSRWDQWLVPDFDHYYREDGISLEVLRVNARFKVTMHDSNPNPFWEEARSLENQGRLREAREYYRQAWNFNPYDARRRAIGVEWAEILAGLGEEQEADRLRQQIGVLPPDTPRQDALSSSRQGAYSNSR
jgi:GT2 family glycosyltransferase/glycosyltransferase involved in cell wall biosynthesis